MVAQASPEAVSALLMVATLEDLQEHGLRPHFPGFLELSFGLVAQSFFRG